MRGRVSPPPIVSLDRDASAYPLALASLGDAPPQLRVRGSLPPLARAVAIVGTRRPSERGSQLARRLARELAESGCPIVSGGAVGIDHAAHVGALDAHGITIVVHASGLNVPYPAAHGPLYAAIVERGGCELSEHDDDEAPRRHTFLARNRIIAALARVVLVVEAPLASGALSTAAHARSLGVPVLAVPRVPEVESALGSNELIRRGATPCLGARDVLDLVEHLPAVSERAAPRRDARRRRTAAPLRGPRPSVASDLGPEHRDVLAWMERGVVEADDLVERLGRPASVVVATLAELELRGLVVERRDGRFELVG